MEKLSQLRLPAKLNESSTLSPPHQLDDTSMVVTQYIMQYAIQDGSVLLLNTLTGAVDVVNERVAELLRQRTAIDLQEFAPEELQHLVSRGYLLQHGAERAQVARWFSDFKKRMKSWHFIVCPTFTCNLRCPYCYESLDIRRSKHVISHKQVDDMFDAMERLIAERNAEGVQLEFFGGEPFLRANRHTVELILGRAAANGWKISGISNGTQIDAYFDIFEHYSKSITQMQITIDGPQDVHDKLRVTAAGRGSYAAINRNVTELLKRSVPVALRVNTGADNVQHLPRLFEQFEIAGWTQYPFFYCQLAPVNDHGCTGAVSNYQPEFKLLAQLHTMFPNWEATRSRYNVALGYDMERRTSLVRFALYGRRSPALRLNDLSGCSASNQHYVVFGADGRLYACPETVGVEAAAIGRYSPEFVVDRDRWSRWDVNISNTAKCRGCNIAPVCGGACPWHGFNASGAGAYEPHCNYAKETIKAYLDLNRPQLQAALGLPTDG